MNDIVI